MTGSHCRTRTSTAPTGKVDTYYGLALHCDRCHEPVTAGHICWSRPSDNAGMRQDLEEIARHLRMIVAHRDDPSSSCEDPPGAGCAGAMLHDADDALAIVNRLLESDTT